MTGEAHSSNHPPLPPTTEDQRNSWLRLLRSRRIGIASFFRLIAEYGTAQNVLIALPELASQKGVKGYEVYPLHMLEAEIKIAKAASARLLCFGEPDYPKHLMELANAPPALWCRGDLGLLRRPSLSMVGARNASSLGLRMARALAEDLGRAGRVISSGLARGIDTAAHEAALPTGTIAVLASGVDLAYPKENQRLYDQIAESGLLLSEQPMGQKPIARNFPARNRIIAGLGQATLVVEAAAKSGSLITAGDALDLGREVMAVPGHPLDARASGCNILIRDGATLVRRAEDVLDALAPLADPAPAPSLTRAPTTPTAPPPECPPLSDLPRPPEQRSLQETSALHQELLARLSVSPATQDELLNSSPNPPRQVLELITDLELRGDLERSPEGVLSRRSSR